MAATDLASVIAEFCADAARTSFELPHMTTGQRKSAKQLVSQFSELRCESYGFGADRQLHLFKNGANESTAEDECGASEKAPDFSRFAVNIKNTFIDDWSAMLSNASPTANARRAVQTMPHDMFRQCMWAETEEAKEATGYDTPTTGCDTASESETESMPCPLVETHGLPIGGLVVVEGLAKMPAFNGCSAVVQGWDEETGRYKILIAGPTGCQEAKIKDENLRLVLNCPR